MGDEEILFKVKPRQTFQYTKQNTAILGREKNKGGWRWKQGTKTKKRKRYLCVKQNNKIYTMANNHNQLTSLHKWMGTGWNIHYVLIEKF